MLNVTSRIKLLQWIQFYLLRSLEKVKGSSPVQLLGHFNGILKLHPGSGFCVCVCVLFYVFFSDLCISTIFNICDLAVGRCEPMRTTGECCIMAQSLSHWLKDWLNGLVYYWPREAEGFCQRLRRRESLPLNWTAVPAYPTFHMDMYVNDSQWTGDEEAGALGPLFSALLKRPQKEQ